MTGDLMVRAQAGDVEAFGELYAAHVEDVRRYAESRHPGHGDDIAQDVFVRALGALHTWRDQGKSPGAWLRTITVNLCHDRAKSCHYRRSTPVDFGAQHQGFESMRDEHPEGDPEDLIVERLSVAAVLRAFGQLTDSQRECLIHRFVHGRKIWQTAAAMGLGESATKSLQHRAIGTLSRLLAADGAVAGA